MPSSPRQYRVAIQRFADDDVQAFRVVVYGEGTISAKSSEFESLSALVDALDSPGWESHCTCGRPDRSSLREKLRWISHNSGRWDLWGRSKRAVPALLYILSAETIRGKAVMRGITVYSDIPPRFRTGGQLKFPGRRPLSHYRQGSRVARWPASRREPPWV